MADDSGGMRKQRRVSFSRGPLRTTPDGHPLEVVTSSHSSKGMTVPGFTTPEYVLNALELEIKDIRELCKGDPDFESNNHFSVNRLKKKIRLARADESNTGGATAPARIPKPKQKSPQKPNSNVSKKKSESSISLTAPEGHDDDHHSEASCPC